MKNVTPSGNRTQASHNLWFQVQHSPFWTKSTFACKIETLGPLYSHALLILTESSKSKNQVVHEQKFKDLSSTCQVSPERIVLDLEPEVMRGLGSIGGNILLLYFLFSHCKASDANIGIIANVVCLWKPRLTYMVEQKLEFTETGWERLIRSHSSARFCFELSRNLN